jgi:acyl-coenzyme A synthetase/AMP-(fatty) acid ligase
VEGEVRSRDNRRTWLYRDVAYLHFQSSGTGPAGILREVLPGYQARLVDDFGNDVAEGQTGTLLVKDDSSAAYYYRHHEKTEQAMLGEWFNTGDKYMKDPDGYYFYQGRADDMLKVGGIWVSLIEIEDTMLGHSAVSKVPSSAKPMGQVSSSPRHILSSNRGTNPRNNLRMNCRRS